MGNKLSMDEFIRRVQEKNKYVKNGDIEIIGEYNGVDKRIEYICHVCNTVQNPIASSLLHGNGCKTCGQIQSGITQRKSHQEFVQELLEVNDSITPIGKYTTRTTNMEFMCRFGHIWKATPRSVLDGSRCPYCSNKKVLVGFNDIATTSPDIFKYLANPEDGYKYTRYSNVRVDFKCPLCGLTQNRKIATIAHRGFRCEHCGSGISYPNKFGRALFDQLLPGRYKAEYHPKWGYPYVYDIYFKLNGKEYIIEWDGRQHFEDRDTFGMSLVEHQNIDKIKTELARSNNVCLIRIDCAKSECNYIKNNIEKSELKFLFDLAQIDWKLCDERAQKNLVKVVCDLWMSGMRSFDDIAEYLHLGNSTVRSYINRGVKFGWCDYDSKKWIVERCHPIQLIDIINNQEYCFKSLGECATSTSDICGHRISEETIRKYCEKGVPYMGFMFKYIDLTVQN